MVPEASEDIRSARMRDRASASMAPAPLCSPGAASGSSETSGAPGAHEQVLVPRRATASPGLAGARGDLCWLPQPGRIYHPWRLPPVGPGSARIPRPWEVLTTQIAAGLLPGPNLAPRTRLLVARSAAVTFPSGACFPARGKAPGARGGRVPSSSEAPWGFCCSAATRPGSAQPAPSRGWGEAGCSPRRPPGTKTPRAAPAAGGELAQPTCGAAAILPSLLAPPRDGASSSPAFPPSSQTSLLLSQV